MAKEQLLSSKAMDSDVRRTRRKATDQHRKTGK